MQTNMYLVRRASILAFIPLFPPFPFFLPLHQPHAHNFVFPQPSGVIYGSSPENGFEIFV
jgi:hypothetical protein